MRKRTLASCAAASLGLSVGLAISGTAAANHSPPHLHEPVTSDCGETTFQADLPAETHGSYADARLVVDDGSEVHVAELGEPITVGPFTQENVKIHYRVFGGGERNYDLPLWNGHEDGPGDWRDDINEYGAEHGWEWTLAGVEDANPFVRWETVTVEGCPRTGPSADVTVAVSCDLLVVAARNLTEDLEVRTLLGVDTDTSHGAVENAEALLGMEAILNFDELPVSTAELPEDVTLTDTSGIPAGHADGVGSAPGEAHAHGITLIEGIEVEILIGIFDDGNLDNFGGGGTVSWDEIAAALDCPGDEDTVGKVVDDSGTDELAATGSPTLWIAGIAMALLIAGGGLFFLTRRRGVDFTA